jgi:hypothetical protein
MIRVSLVIAIIQALVLLGPFGVLDSLGAIRIGK